MHWERVECQVIGLYRFTIAKRHRFPIRWLPKMYLYKKTLFINYFTVLKEIFYEGLSDPNLHFKNIGHLCKTYFIIILFSFNFTKKGVLIYIYKKNDIFLYIDLISCIL